MNPTHRGLYQYLFLIVLFYQSYLKVKAKLPLSWLVKIGEPRNIVLNQTWEEHFEYYYQFYH